MPVDYTSHDVVAKIRSRFKLPKVGHGGTLDPQATGLLVLLLGKGTKLSQFVMGSDKVYEGTMRLGVETSTQDMEGEVIRESDPSAVTRAMLEAEFAKLTGDLMQMPPMVSAIKKNGVPLYKLARKGETIEREPRPVHVFEFRLKEFDPPVCSFLLHCTKGTYVRTICHDIGQALGCGCAMETLRRTSSGKMTLEKAVTMDVLDGLTREDLVDYIIPLAKAQVEFEL